MFNLPRMILQVPPLCKLPWPDTAATTAKPAKAKAMDATSTTTSGATTRPFRENAAAMQN